LSKPITAAYSIRHVGPDVYVRNNELCKPKLFMYMYATGIDVCCSVAVNCLFDQLRHMTQEHCEGCQPMPSATGLNKSE